MASLVCAAARIVHVRSSVGELRSSFRGMSLSSSSSVAMPCLLSARTTQPSLQAPAKLLPIQPVVAAGYKLKTHKVGFCLLLLLSWISCFECFLLERKDEETLDFLFLGEKWIFLNPTKDAPSHSFCTDPLPGLFSCRSESYLGDDGVSQENKPGNGENESISVATCFMATEISVTMCLMVIHLVWKMTGISEKVFSDWQWQNRAEASRKATSTEEKERKAQEPSRGQGMSSAMRCFLSSKVVIERFFLSGRVLLSLSCV